MVIFCRKSSEPFVFRAPIEADFLGSQARRLNMLPTHELDPSLFSNAGGKLLRSGQTMGLEVWQRESAVGHWQVMRTVLPKEIWENW